MASKIYTTQKKFMYGKKKKRKKTTRSDKNSRQVVDYSTHERHEKKTYTECVRNMAVIYGDGVYE